MIYYNLTIICTYLLEIYFRMWIFQLFSILNFSILNFSIFHRFSIFQRFLSEHAREVLTTNKFELEYDEDDDIQLSEEQMANPDFLLYAVYSGYSLFQLPDKHRFNPDFIKVAILANPLCFAKLLPYERGNKDFAEIAVSRCGALLENVSEDLQNDISLIRIAVCNYPIALKHASEELRANHEVFLCAVSKNGAMLEIASDNLKADPEIVFAAVQDNPFAFRFASEELRNNFELWLIASKNRENFQYLSFHLKCDLERVVVPFLFEHGSIILRYIPVHLHSVLGPLIDFADNEHKARLTKHFLEVKERDALYRLDGKARAEYLHEISAFREEDGGSS